MSARACAAEAEQTDCPRIREMDVPIPAQHTQPQRRHGEPESVFRAGRLFASFMHLYFASNPAAIAQLFKP